MKAAQVAIIGGGLSGLYAAWLLDQMGIEDYVVFEANQHIGGRVASPMSIDQSAQQYLHFDLGGTWFWPDFQPLLDRVIKQFGLNSFAQYETGDMVFDRSNSVPPQRTHGFINEPTMMRLDGGMHKLAEAIKASLKAERIKTALKVERLEHSANGINLAVRAHDDQVVEFSCHYVLLAIPPRLALSSILFSPALPEELDQSWRSTSTWMASHAKYLAVYDKPFWRAKGLSGEARSLWGPMAEIHDASPQHGQGALFGFLRIPATNRAWVPEKDLISSCRAQLVRLFGPEATNPSAEFFKDWAKDSTTATDADLVPVSSHDTTPSSIVDSGVWRNKIIGIASE
jgi:monoamine oxidase